VRGAHRGLHLTRRRPPRGALAFRHHLAEVFEHLVAAIRTRQYGWVAEKGNFILFRRGAPPATAEAYLVGIGAKP